MTFRSFRVGLCLSIAVLTGTVAGPAGAQSPAYWVEARAVTGTMPGAGATYVGPLAGEVSAHAEHDPPGLQWTFNVNQQLYSDAAAEAWTDIGTLAAHASAAARRVAATNFPPGVTASTYGNWVDRVTVASDTLPVGAPVTLTFANVMSVDWQGSGLYDGNASCLLQVGGASSTAKWSAAYNKAESTAAAAPLVIKTTVGAKLSLNGRLTTFARGAFFVPGPQYDGAMEVNATCDAQLLGATGDVHLIADSGVDHAS